MTQTRCPICKKPVAMDAATFPFCSARCRLVDLSNWLDGNYRIPSDAPEGEEH